jgi:hypothetical protein
LWLPPELDVDAGVPFPCPPEDAPPPDELIPWLELDPCPLSELIECVLEEVETLGGLEILGELALLELDGIDAGGELWVGEVEELEGMLGECCAKRVIDTNSRLAVAK